MHADRSGKEMDRREFVTVTGTGAAAIAGLPIVAGPFDRRSQGDHFIPEDKKLTEEWIRSLVARGASSWYSGEDLKTIGMPVGGICAGQVYLTGDGRLTYWDIFNQNQNTGYGAVNYKVGRLPTETVRNVTFVPSVPIDQGFALRVRSAAGSTSRTLDRRGFPGVRFCGEYPIGRVEYVDATLPVEIRLEAFSPFVPLNAAASALPATIMRYVVRNTADVRVEVTLSGWLENAVCRINGEMFAERFIRRNEAFAGDGLTAVIARAVTVELEQRPERPATVFATFDGGDYGNWVVEGEAFGSAPARGTLEGQSPVTGFAGDGLVNTFLDGDRPHGTLRSPPFTIERPFIAFLIGGGAHQGRTCMNLIVDGAVVRTATGKNTERLEPHNWNVADLVGAEAHLEIVDAESGGWGHVNVDQIEFRDSPRFADPGALETWLDYGTLCLAVTGDGFSRASVPSGPMPDVVFDGTDDVVEKPWGQALRGAVGRVLSLGPGEEEAVTFVVSWHMPNMYRDEKRVGNRYAALFQDAGSVAAYLAENLDSLSEQTRLWHRTYYESTLPHWLLDRLHSTVANLASTTCQWWENGRFWAWEGGGCCHGTCGHVWNYEHALARLFPDLERSVREMQDFVPGIGFHPDTGAIGFRGEGWTLWAGDSQGGYILKAYREFQTSTDDAFLRRNWPQIRQAVQFLIDQDANADGLIEGSQHQTYDENYFGPNTMVGSLYLGALRAAEEMSRHLGDEAFASRCRRIFELGRANSVATLFNGEYYVQVVDLEQHPEWQYGDGCLADHMFGQGWAHQVGLGYLYPEETVTSSLRSIWRYNWAPDIGPQNAAHEPERWFAYPGEAGLFTCTWPKSAHMGPRSTRYRNEIWTGIEYQVAGHMAWEGMLLEALAICRGAHERYHPSKHNPWNEIECGDHYARAMASWGVLIGLAGFEYHGPNAHIGIAPRITPEDFRCVFTGAEGWGSASQRRGDRTQANAFEVRWGRLMVRSVGLEVPAGVRLEEVSAAVDGNEIEIDAGQTGRKVTLRLPAVTMVEAGSTLSLSLGW